MGDVGLLLSLPTESIAVRVALAAVVALVLAKGLASSWVRSRRSRAALALVPTAAVLVVLAAYASDPALPSVWHTIDAAGGLTVPVRDTYLSFAPAALPLILAAWAAVAAVRVSLRVTRHVRASRALVRLGHVGREAPPAVQRRVDQLAAALQVRAPETVLVPGLPGGGAVVGMHTPRLLLDERLVGVLDDQELDGILAHELAHVQRRDNLVVFLLCLVRDVVFFVPGGGWSLRMLLREREHAADAVAADVTQRPAALAGGLLKVLETRRSSGVVACASLLSEGTLVARVEELIGDRPAPTPVRRTAEGSAVVGAAAAAVVVAAVIPTVIAGPMHERDALGVLLSDVATDTSVAVPRSAVFQAFDGAPGATTSAAIPVASSDEDRDLLDVGDLDVAGAAGWEACAREDRACDVVRGPRVSLPAHPILRVEDGSATAWRLEPIVVSDSEERALFWFSRLGVS